MTSPFDTVSDTIVPVIAAMLLAGCAEQRYRGMGSIDRTRAFYYPGFAKRGDAELGHVAGVPIDAATYLRYLAGRFGTRYIEELAFDIALERECHARGLARSAPVLARSTAAMRIKASGRSSGSDPDYTQQRKFANESLRKLRIDAIAAAERSEDDAAVRALFDRRHGVGGERVTIRQVLVSFPLTRRRLERAAQPADKDAVAAAARARATLLRRRLDGTMGFARLLAESDDRTTRTLLRDPEHAAEAGLLPGYNYQRYGEAFATAVRKLSVGQISAAIPSEVGYHLIELVDRVVTKLVDVEVRLRRELRRGPARPAQIVALRRRLLQKYGFAVPSHHH